MKGCLVRGGTDGRKVLVAVLLLAAVHWTETA